jgi:hypothetical protein
MSAVEQIQRAVEQLSAEEYKQFSAWMAHKLGEESNRDQEQAEEQADLQAAREALAEPGDNISWEQIKAEVGLK